MGLAAGLGALGVGVLGSAAIGSSASKSAAKSASQAADQSAQVYREVYGQNKEILTPFVSRGNTAGNYINAMLGIPGEMVTTPAPATSPTNALTSGMVNIPGVGSFPLDTAAGQWANATAGSNVFGQPVVPGGAQQPSVNPEVTSQQARDAFRAYIENSDYGFRFGEGANAVNSGYAGNGVLQSGAAMRAMEEFRQNLQAGYRGEFMGALGNQQGVGLSAGSALAGVGTNYANSLGNIYMAAGDAKANAALSRAANNPFNALASIGGTILGAKL